MKTSRIRLLSLILAAIPMMAAAQTNIRSAFNAIINCPEAQITESHTLEKDTATGRKRGQSDVYRFVLPVDKADLIKKVLAAFEKDADMAYSINRGKTANTDRDIILTVGNADGDGVCINDLDCEYICSLFLAPLSEDPDGHYRYAYGMNCKEVGGKFVGKLVITYATTLKYRQQAERQRQYNVLRSFSGSSSSFSGSSMGISSSVSSSQQSWFDTLMSYFQSMASANAQTRIALATKAYKVIQETSEYPEVSQADKDTVREILKGMIADKNYSETVLNKLLNRCLTEIK